MSGGFVSVIDIASSVGTDSDSASSEDRDGVSIVWDGASSVGSTSVE